MVIMGTYTFKSLDTGMIKLQELFTNACLEEIHELEQVCTYIKLLGLILND